jgi:hypothetical protein
MEPAEPPEPAVLRRLGEDLLLLAVRPDSGRIATAQRITYGLMGSELVRLAALRRIDIVRNRIVVLRTGVTGDAELDAALRSITGARRPPSARSWVGRPRRGIRDAYLARLAATGALQGQVGGFMSATRWTIGAPERAQDARARLDAIAGSTGPVDITQTAFGGLARAAGLDRFLYPRFSDRPWRRRLAEVAAGKWTTPQPPPAAADDAVPAGSAQAAMLAATSAAIQAAVQASTDAAVAAATAASG